MSLYIRLHNIISPNKFSVYYKAAENLGNVNSGFTYYNSYTGSTTDLTISDVGLTFNTKYWIKIVDDITGKYIVENINTHESCYYDCFDITPTPTVTKTPTPTPTIGSVATSTPTPTPTQTRTPPLESCVQIDYVLKFVDNLGCGILDRYYEYTITYLENGSPAQAPVDITYTVITNKDGSTSYPIILSAGSTTVTDDSVLIREWDNCAEKNSNDYEVIDTQLTPSYSICAAITPTPTTTPTTTPTSETCIKVTQLIVSGYQNFVGTSILKVQILLDDTVNVNTQFSVYVLTSNIGGLFIYPTVNKDADYATTEIEIPGLLYPPVPDAWCITQVSGDSRINCNGYNCQDISCPCSND